MYNVHILWTCILGLERQRQNLPSRIYKTAYNLLLKQKFKDYLINKLNQASHQKLLKNVSNPFLCFQWVFSKVTDSQLALFFRKPV